MRYFMSIFMLAWLGGWAVGWISAASTLSSGGTGRGGPNAFLAFWLVGWTVGGVWAMYSLYRLLRRPVAELLRLTAHGVMYDSGIPPLSTFSGYASRKEAWKSMFPKRTRVELDRQKLQTLRLRETNGGNRLTVDADALRLDIAQSASEIEREWLYQMLVKRYSLTPAQGR
jgi:hypothetical protein